MTLLAGTRLGPYEILAPLGAGGMGEVYKARDTRLDRNVAVKVLPTSVASDPAALARFEREAKAVAALSHPNILALHDIGKSDGVTYAVMELLEGETLGQRLSEGPLPPRKVTEIAREIALGLAAAHDKGIVHRDLKPGNLFLTKDGRVKILDFGLARQLALPSGGDTQSPTATPGTEPGTVLGTVGYMAPEQLRGQPADNRSDIFSFGAVLYEMLSGQRAFRGATAIETMSAILKEDPPSLMEGGRSMPPALERIVGHCLEKRPEARFQSAHDLAFNLEALSAISEPAARAAPPAMRSRRAWLARAAVLTAGLATIAAVSYLAVARAETRRSSSFVSFAQKTYDPQPIFVARFASDGRTIVYSAAPEGIVPQIFAIRPEYPEPRPLGPPQSHVLSVSSRGELAILTHAKYVNERFFTGTLARMPLGEGAPREVLENVREADWSPDGSSLAIIREVEGKDRLEYPPGKALWQTGGYLSDLRVSPKGDRIAFFEHPIRYDDRGLVAVVDGAGRRTVLSDGYGSEEGLAWSPNGDEVFYSAQAFGSSGGTVYAVTLSGKRRVALTSAGGLTIQDVGRDGRWLVTRDDVRLNVMFGEPGGKAERDLTWLGNSVYPVLSSDGRKLLLTDINETGGPYYAACLRGTDGSPMVRLGEGSGADLSTDGAWAIAIVPTTPQQLRLYPTGPGQPRTLERGNLEAYRWAFWCRDGRTVVSSAHEPGRANRCYVQSVASGPPKAVTPEGTTGCRPSPDGEFVLASERERISLYPIAGGPARQLPLSTSEGRVLRWSSDGRSLWIRSLGIPVRIERFDLETGRREPVEEIAPRDRIGLLSIFDVSLADDPRSYAYVSYRFVSRLFAVEGAR
jgi:serine/threonine protein kinase